MANQSAVPKNKNGAITKTARRQMAAKACEMREDGYKLREIAAELGVSTGVVSALVPRTSEPREDAINPATLVAWIEAHSETDSYDGLRINGQPLPDSQKRGHYRWREEGAAPGFATVERLLCEVLGTRFDEFETWAGEQSPPLQVWMRGRAPSWWTDTSSSRWMEDLESEDPQWAAEAQDHGIRTGVLTKDGRRRWSWKPESRGPRSTTKSASKKKPGRRAVSKAANSEKKRPHRAGNAPSRGKKRPRRARKVVCR